MRCCRDERRRDDESGVGRRHAAWRAGFAAVLARDVQLALRRRADVLGSVVFFIIVASLVPLAVGPELKTLRLIGPGMVWVAALLASMLALHRLFAADHADGTLEQMLLAPYPLPWLVLAKVAAHWATSSLPLIAIAPLLAVQYDLAAPAIGVLVLSLLLGTPVLGLIGAVGAALTLGLRGAGVLLSLLVLPLYVPVLIFGAGAVEAQAAGLGAQAHLSLLGACLALAFLFAPWAAAAALRIAME
jgi:heme exporter protein B